MSLGAGAGQTRWSRVSGRAGSRVCGAGHGCAEFSSAQGSVAVRVVPESAVHTHSSQVTTSHVPEPSASAQRHCSNSSLFALGGRAGSGPCARGQNDPPAAGSQPAAPRTAPRAALTASGRRGFLLGRSPRVQLGEEGEWRGYGGANPGCPLLSGELGVPGPLDGGGGVSPGVADLRVGQLTSLLWLILVFDRVLNVSCVSRSCTELWGPQLSSVWQLAV